MTIQGVEVSWPPPPIEQGVADQWGILAASVPWTSILVTSETAGNAIAFTVLDDEAKVMTIYPFMFQLQDVPRMLAAMSQFMQNELERISHQIGELPEELLAQVAVALDGGDVVAGVQVG